MATVSLLATGRNGLIIMNSRLTLFLMKDENEARETLRIHRISIPTLVRLQWNLLLAGALYEVQILMRVAHDDHI
jgi:hypothetical protein